jgi:hypothetical protein
MWIPIVLFLSGPTVPRASQTPPFPPLRKGREREGFELENSVDSSSVHEGTDRLLDSPNIDNSDFAVAPDILHIP